MTEEKFTDRIYNTALVSILCGITIGTLSSHTFFKLSKIAQNQELPNVENSSYQQNVRDLALGEIHEYDLTLDDRIDLVMQTSQGPRAFINIGGGEYIPAEKYLQRLDAETAKELFIEDKISLIRKNKLERDFYISQMQAFIPEHEEREK